MPYKLELTWIAHAKRWRKRYRGRTYYLKSKNTGKTDRGGYIAALHEWERLKNFTDGIGETPYTPTGAVIPNGQSTPAFTPVAPARNPIVTPQVGKCSADPAWIQTVGIGQFLHPEQIVTNSNGNPYAGERRIELLADFWLQKRLQQSERGQLSLKQYAEDRTKFQVFRDFLAANYPTTIYIGDINAAMMNLFRDKQQETLAADKKVTLRKRLETVARFFHWLADENIITTPPRDLRTYARVKLNKPTLVFFTVEEIRQLATVATERTKLYLMLGLNLAWTQRDIATLTPDMLDWDTGVITRPRQKTSVPTQFKLWPSTLDLLTRHRNPKAGPVLVDQNGSPLLVERINSSGKYTQNDTIRQAFDRILNNAGLTGRGFKHLRKTAANELEKIRPDLTSLFLGHSERATKKFYVAQHFEELFVEVAKLESLFGFA